MLGVSFVSTSVGLDIAVKGCTSLGLCMMQRTPKHVIYIRLVPSGSPRRLEWVGCQIEYERGFMATRRESEPFPLPSWHTPCYDQTWGIFPRPPFYRMNQTIIKQRPRWRAISEWTWVSILLCRISNLTINSRSHFILSSCFAIVLWYTEFLICDPLHFFFFF